MCEGYKNDGGFELEIEKPAQAKEVFFFNDSANLAAFDQNWTEKDGRLKQSLAILNLLKEKRKSSLELWSENRRGQQAYLMDSPNLSDSTAAASLKSAGRST